MALNLFLWVWDYTFAFTVGLNSASHAFTLHYRTLFWGELLSVGVFAGLWFGWLVRTGMALDREDIPPAEEVRRIAILWSIIGATSLSLYIEASFWPNWDGAWHQTMVRDTALTPTHIPMFYFFFPLSVVLALGAYLYGRFRIPAVYAPEKGFPWSFFLSDIGGSAGVRAGRIQRVGPQPVAFRRILFGAVPLAVRGLRMAGERNVRGLGRDDFASVPN